MTNDISLGLNEASRDKGVVLTLLASRINNRMIRDLYHHLSGPSPEKVDEIYNVHVREELAWVFRTLGEDGGLTASGLQELLDR
ncbi:hypothetical protein ARNL5_00361 [Anaerolineae bacterium]|nr:hypothetical protein ARNL5_00361 [Anaerolineae bacterium]